MLIRRKLWTQQPQFAAQLRGRQQYKFLLTPHHPILGGTLSGAIARAYTPYGVGFAPGGGNYFSAPAGTIIDSAGAGNDPNVDLRFSVTFVITSNGAADAIASFGTTPTSGGPLVFVQNNAGSLRVLVNAGTYITYGAVEVGKLYTVDVTYSDISPYVWAVRVNGQLVGTRNGYENGLDTQAIYVGTGFGGATANAIILQATFEQGMHVDLSDGWSLERGANPWAIYAPLVQRIPLSVAAATVPSITAVYAESVLSDRVTPRVTLDFA